MVEPTVAASYPRAFLSFAVSRGADRCTLLARAGLSGEQLSAPDARVPLRRYLAMIEAGIELCGEPALALLFGEAVPMDELSLAWPIGAAARTVEEARHRINRYAPLAIDGAAGDEDHLQFERERDVVWIRFANPLLAEHRWLAESTLARCVCTARRHRAASSEPDRVPPLRAVHFTHPAPAYGAHYERIFQTPLVFGSVANALVTDAALLTMRMPATSTYVSGVLQRHADEVLDRLQRNRSVSGRVEQVLERLLPVGDARMDVVAARLGLSRATLFRRLKSEGTTFDAVLDGLRRRLALAHLRQGDLTVAQVARLVGFSEAAAFSRAFTRWTGGSPRAARSAHGSRSSSSSNPELTSSPPLARSTRST